MRRSAECEGDTCTVFVTKTRTQKQGDECVARAGLIRAGALNRPCACLLALSAGPLEKTGAFLILQKCRPTNRRRLPLTLRGHGSMSLTTGQLSVQ